MFDHGSFTRGRAQLLLEAQLRDNALDAFMARKVVSRTPVTESAGDVPRWPLAYSYARSDKRAKIAFGDRAVIYQSKMDNISYVCERTAPAESINHVEQADLNALQNGGALDRLANKVTRQALLDIELDFNTIVSGAGSAGDHTLVDLLALPAGDEFNAAAPAKTPEEYFREAVAATGGSAAFMCVDVWWALLANATMAENGLNQHSMTDAELRDWFKARGIEQIFISIAQAQDAPPEQGFSKSYVHAGVCAVGQLEAIQYCVLNDLGMFSARDDLAKTDYIVADADYDFVIGFEEVVRAFTNTLA